MRMRRQAMAELLIILIPILIMFMGMWYVSGVGRDRVELYLETRGKAEVRASMTGSSPFAKSLTEWNYGSDGIMFSADDCPMYATSDCYGAFIPEVNGSQLPVSSISSRMSHNFVDNLASPIFAVGADLVPETGSKLPMSYQGDDRSKLIETFNVLFGGDAGAEISEDVFIPAMQKGF